MDDGYQATHAVPPTGLPAWPVPDGSGPRAGTLDPGLDIEVFERRADWAHIRCSNGWEAWIDGRNLVALPPAAPAPADAPEPAPVDVLAPTPRTDEPAPAPEADAPAPTSDTDAPVAVAPELPVDAPAPAPTPHADAPVPVPVAVTEPAPTGQPDAWAAGAAPPPRRGFEFGVAHVLVIVGSLLAAVAAFLPWLSFRGDEKNAFDVPLKFLLDAETLGGGVKLGVALVVLAGLGIVSVFVRPVRWFSIVIGALVIAIGLRLMQQVGPLLDDLEQSNFFADRFDVLKYGTYLAIAGGVLALVGGILTLRKPR